MSVGRNGIYLSNQRGMWSTHPGVFSPKSLVMNSARRVQTDRVYSHIAPRFSTSSPRIGDAALLDNDVAVE